MTDQYGFWSHAERVIDGDTLVARATLFIDTERLFVVRLLGVNTPELRSKSLEERQRALSAKVYVEERVMRATFEEEEDVPFRMLLNLTGLRDVYGRYLGRVTIAGDDLSEMIVAAGHGQAVEYREQLAQLAAPAAYSEAYPDA